MENNELSYEQLLAQFEKYIEEQAFTGFPNVLLGPASHIMQVKGKRIRPLLLLTACQVFGGDLKKAIGPAAAVELFHNFSLVHDDIIDEADIRRGKPAVHIVFGTNKAILTGDAMLIHAVNLLTKGPQEKMNEMMTVFLKAASEVIEGEQYDVNFEELPEVSEKDYLMMIKFKTSVLLAAALQLGALIGGASEKDQEHIYNFGLFLGLSFQIKDDFLDTYGDIETFGKKIGGDILQNKKTYLLIKALENASYEDRTAIFKLFHEINPEKKINGVIALYDKLGVKEKTFNKMEELYKRSIDSFNNISLDYSLKESLLKLAELVYHRSH